ALYVLAGHWSLMVAALITFVTEGGLALLVFIAAGGYGDVIVRPLVGEDCPAGLRVATACGAGLWALGAAVLVIGSLTHGLLTGWLWWPVIGLGLVIAAWRGRGFLEGSSLPREIQGRSLIWVLLAVAVAVWITGATRPSGLVGTLGGDEYDVVEYHLQAPREYHDAGHVAPLRHNVYSHFPMGVEMLFLLSMCLRGGPYEGLYAAKLMHGLFAVAAVLAIVSCFRREEVRGWASGVLLATMPFVCYLSWLGMVELAEMFYLTLALLWLRRWAGDRSLRSAACVGMAMGGACAVKYLSVGFVVLPVVAMMALLSLARPRTTWHVLVAGATTVLLFSPWLIRNAATVGNPVFPLATSVFGSGDHWATGSDEQSAELRQRWV
ncbi:MAG: glycosyltransferase family 39 protein, partial [Phycisphaerae bacterium]|nr:glycosyltransferase family 39 protein [Phycisphaerae bacterium]